MSTVVRPRAAIIVGLVGLACNKATAPAPPTVSPEPAPAGTSPTDETPDEPSPPVSRWPRTRAELSDQPIGAELSMADRHACLRLADGSVRCWGSAALRSLPVRSTTSSVRVPTVVPQLADAVQVATSTSVTCFLRSSGTVECVGRSYAPVPEPVPGFEDIVEIGIDSSFGLCGVTPEGRVICEQYQRDRQQATPLPAQIIDGLERVVALAVDSLSACAVHDDGHVSCWKRSMDYLARQPVESPPQPVPQLDEAVGVAVGLLFACAWRKDGSAHCWGSNRYGELGNPQVDRASVPVPVVGIPSIAEIDAGSHIACARTTDGEVWCWGRGEHLALQGGTTGATPPTRVEGVEHIIDLSVADNGACALAQDGAVYCWGASWPTVKADITMKTGATRITREVEHDGQPSFDARAWMAERGVDPAAAPPGWIYAMCDPFQLEDPLPQWLWCERRQPLAIGGYVLREGLLQVEAGAVEVLLDEATAVEPPSDFDDWLGLSLDLMPSMRPYTIDLESDEISGCRAARQDLREIRRDWDEQLDEARDEARADPDDPDLEADVEYLERALAYDPEPVIARVCSRVGKFVYRNGKFRRR